MMFNQGPPGMGVAPRQKVLPAWIRAELAKREEEKMKKEQKEMEKNMENLQEQKQNNNGLLLDDIRNIFGWFFICWLKKYQNNIGFV